MVQPENADNSSETGMGLGTPMALLEQGLMVMGWAEMGSGPWAGLGEPWGSWTGMVRLGNALTCMSSGCFFSNFSFGKVTAQNLFTVDEKEKKKSKLCDLSCLFFF